MKKLIGVQAVFFIILSFLCSSVNASVLGSVLINGYTVEIGESTNATQNTWYSDQEGVGQQTENYVTYYPNSSVEPITTNKEYIFGKSTIMSEVSRIRKNGIVPIAGINADFFSFQTGVPMSNIIVDGKILSKDGTKQYGIGITDDNKAFMSEFTLYSVLKKADGTSTNIYNINKYRQPYAIYMMTDEFSAETHNSTDGIDVILGSIEGEMKIGTDMTAVVEYISEYSGSIAIPKGKIVLTVDKDAPEEFVNAISTLTVGEKITVSYGVEGDERWKTAKLGIGATGGMLLENGVVNPSLKTGADPRTALGIKSDGSLILYTIDGRQKGYSYGVQLKTLANRLKELGCTDAINLDGGGSTSFVMQFPGDDLVELINKPSEGSLRSVSNYIFLKNNLSKTGKLGHLTIYPFNSYVLTGATAKLSVKASDTSYYSMSVPSDISFYVEEGKESTIDNSGNFTANDSGTVRVYATSENITGFSDIVCLKTPTSINIADEDTKKAVSTLNIKRLESVNLTASAYAGYNKLICTDNNFEWKCDETIGSVDKSGNFTASDVLNATGNIYVTAGEKTVTIPVTVTRTGDENDSDLYPQFEIKNENENFTIKITNHYGLTVSKDNIKVKVDGNDIDFTYDNEELKFILPSDTVKLTVIASNDENYTTYKSISLNSESYENPFYDTSEHWAENIISYLCRNKIINGEKTSSGYIFNPNKSMTRAEFTVMITNYLGENTADYEDVVLPYKDADKIPLWAKGSFKALYKLGIVNGVTYADGSVCSNYSENITRQEAATIISRILPDKIFKSDIDSSDKNEISEWAYEGLSKLKTIGAIGGYEDDTIRPVRNITKAEAAKILFSII